MSIINAKGDGAEQDRHASHFGLGADGWARARELARAQGVGAEQDRYGSHFSINKSSIDKAAQSIQDGAKDAADGLRK
ncbi:hypothetical protein BU24DRAFT_423136 [Aaosphaeria arxii CBS 175.79]|uniref:Uncharacterized protein n=1 Tax=Aaosphaeria arxii CBS 175.79 TaxID=1450172 RepID=A0A6A5XTY9_9PLEO|nr:uncharacterized protein BU24DRAFT_423136 [Aaosphaeria arxii CBS 175.79]KAF2016788.1 hypothetical protein BU24DRAFT_423136 [Aaosphaeria arxii CBS 175.79]